MSARKTQVTSTQLVAPRRKVAAAQVWKADAGGLAALLAISAAAYFLGVLPVLERHSRAEAQMVELTDAREKAQDAAKLLDATRKQLASAKSDFAASPLQLHPLSQLNQRLATVADIAARSGASLDDVQPGKAVALARLDTQPVHVAGVASFPAFSNLLHRVRTELPDSGVDGFDLTITNPTGVAPMARFEFNLTWYARPSAPRGGAADVKK